VKRAERVRPSRRYPGYLRVYQAEYRRALIRALREEAADLIEAFGMQETIRDLEVRLADPDGESAAGRITRMIVDELGVSSPLRAEGESFNVAAERVYRNRLRRTHLEEAFRFLDEDCVMLDAGEAGMGGACREAIRRILGQVRAVGFLAGLRRRVIEERAPAADLRRLIHLVLFTLHRDVAQSERIRQGDAQPAPPVY
jgi:hypothetical protein